jgi:two-component system, sensor histidine kinase
MSIKNVLRALKYAGAEELPEYDITRGVCVGVNTMCVSIFILNLISGPLFYFLSGNLSVMIGAIGEAIIILGIIAVNKARHYELANVSFYSIIIVATFYFTAILGKDSECILMIVFILGLTFFLFRNLATRVFCIGITLLLLVLLEVNFSYHFVKAAYFSPQVSLFVRWLVYAVVISLVLLSFYLYQRNTRLIIQLYSYSKNIKASLTSEERLNELKNLFFQSISHDIRGAYYGVSGICALIQERVESNQPITEELTRSLMEASDHYKYMLNNFLEVSKFKDATIDHLHLETFDLRQEITKIAELHQYIARQKNIEIQIVFPFRFPERIVGDKLKITRIIYNLLSNAIKFSSVDSTITLTIVLDVDSWTLNVSDQGKGMPADKLKKIFLPFETEISAQNPEGVGLGLYITKYLADILGATISVDSRIAEGTTFRVQFPLQKQLATP